MFYSVVIKWRFRVCFSLLGFFIVHFSLSLRCCQVPLVLIKIITIIFRFFLKFKLDNELLYIINFEYSLFIYLFYLCRVSQSGQTNWDNGEPKNGASGVSLVPAIVKMCVLTKMSPSFNCGIELDIVTHFCCCIERLDVFFWFFGIEQRANCWLKHKWLLYSFISGSFMLNW